jgi:hypothetical protein
VTPEIHDKLDKIMDMLLDQSKAITRLEVLSERNTEDLEEHIRRTDLLEQGLLSHVANYNKFRYYIMGAVAVIAVGAKVAWEIYKLSKGIQ